MMAKAGAVKGLQRRELLYCDEIIYVPSLNLLKNATTL